MAAEEGPVEDPFELPALLALVRRAPGPEVSPPGEAGSQRLREETQGKRLGVREYFEVDRNSGFWLFLMFTARLE